MTDVSTTTDLTARWLGLTLRSPLVIGASPVSDDVPVVQRCIAAGAGAVVLRSLFEEQLVLDQLAAHRYVDSHVDSHAEAMTFLPDSVFDLGATPTLRRLRRLKAAVDVPVIASLNGTTPGGWTAYARDLQDAGADAIELNLYEVATGLHQHSADIEDRQIDVVASVVAAVQVPVSVKLSPFYASVPAFVARIDQAGAAGVVLFNRYYQPDINLDTLDMDRTLVPSTSAELPLRLHALALLHHRTGLSLSAAGGVHRGSDAVKAILCGAHTVQVVSALLADPPGAMRAIHSELAAWLGERGYRDLDEARGATALDNVADPAALERVNYARMLQGWRISATTRS
ncbi:MAG: dihydroorotate dehydrogenase-like protein [Acidimicrobiales bacterium]|nr:dihydroorotate dehydrogenase-like protein [Acidimicrobiales bacterium]